MTDEEFEAAVMAGPNHDNVCDPDVLGPYGLEPDPLEDAITRHPAGKRLTHDQRGGAS